MPASYITEMREKFRRFMAGRYGTDNLSRFVLVVALILLVAEMIISRIAGEEAGTAVTIIIEVCYFLSLLLLIWSIVRSMSRNHQKRCAQNEKYLRAKAKVKGFFIGLFSGNGFSGGDKTHRIYKCPGCGQKVRVPKGKGRIAITCPKCKNSFIKKT